MPEMDELDLELNKMMKHSEHEEFMKLIMYRSQRKWYATISIIFIFGLIITPNDGVHGIG